jgi:chromosome transmission fidelity protein 1
MGRKIEKIFYFLQSDVQDIEDVVKLARELNTCPYYATRAAIAGAHLIVLPYQTLMHKSTREACGIEMRDNVVIIDEAHNLPDAICSMHSNEISGNQVCFIRKFFYYFLQI